MTLLLRLALMAVISIDALPKQIQFLRSPAREVLYSGAFGAGKTRALCLKAVMRAAVPGARELLCRKTNVSLRSTTLHTLLRQDGDLPPVLPPGTYKHNQNEKWIRLHGGGEIAYCGVDDPITIGSLQLTGAGIDEAIELNTGNYDMIRGRIRVKVKGLANQIYSATNPGAPTHFLAERFGLNGSKKAPKTLAIITRSADNFFLPKDYLEDIASFVGVARERYYEGRWVAAEGLVYPELIDCFVDPVPAPDGENFGGIDFGWRNPFCALWATVYHVDNKPILYVHGEQYKAETPIEVHASAMHAAFPSNNCLWAADPENPENIRSLRLSGLCLEKAKKGISDGITAVNGLIAANQLFISEACTNLRKEADVYCYSDKNLKEKPVDTFNHAMDALRYLVMSVVRRGMMEVDYGEA